MAKYVDKNALQEYTTKLTNKYKTLFSSPLVANTAADMTDTEKVYVYVGSETGYTNGNWYYYNGSAWVSGGVYNAVAVETDTTLAVSGKAADSKKVGDEIADIKSALFDEYDQDWWHYAKTANPKGWRAGYYGTSNGNYASSNNYMCSAHRMYVYGADYIEIIPPEGHGVRAYKWRGDTYIGYEGYTNYGERLILNIDPTLNYAFSLNGFNKNSNTFITDEFISSIQFKKHRMQTPHYVPTPNTQYSNPHFVVPKFLYSDVILRDSYYYNDSKYIRTQGLCTDGRYLYYPLKTLGDTPTSIIRKYDLIKKEVVLTSIPTANYGHCEDLCFMPKEFLGFDNNAVDRILMSDANRIHESGNYWTVLNADTLEYIGEYATSSLISTDVATYWQGAVRMTSNINRGKFVLEGGKNVEVDNNTVHHRYLAVFDKDGGTPEKLIRMERIAGTQAGISCDENYIYLTRYASTETTDVFNIYIYVFDWDLNPVCRGTIEQIAWEFEGICNAGNDIYFSWIVNSTEKGVYFSKAKSINGYYPLTASKPFTTFVGFTNIERLI